MWLLCSFNKNEYFPSLFLSTKSSYLHTLSIVYAAAFYVYITVVYVFNDIEVYTRPDELARSFSKLPLPFTPCRSYHVVIIGAIRHIRFWIIWQRPSIPISTSCTVITSTSLALNTNFVELIRSVNVLFTYCPTEELLAIPYGKLHPPHLKHPVFALMMFISLYFIVFKCSFSHAHSVCHICVFILYNSRSTIPEGLYLSSELSLIFVFNAMSNMYWYMFINFRLGVGF